MPSTSDPEVVPVEDLPRPRDALDRVRTLQSAKRAADTELLLLARDWADRHPDSESGDDGRHVEELRLAERRRIAAGWLGDPDVPEDLPFLVVGAEDMDDPWIPRYQWDAGAPFAAALGWSTTSGDRLIRDAPFLRHRMPLLWQRACAGEVEAFRARRIAQAGWAYPADVVEAMDEQVTPRAHSIGIQRLDRLIDEIMLRLHPEERELDQIHHREHHHVTLREEPTPAGFAEIEIRADYVDAADFDRACGAIAEILRQRQEEDGFVPEPLGMRRAAAPGILADPERALAMLRGTDRSDVELDPLRPLAPGVTIFVHLGLDALAGRDVVAHAAKQGLRGQMGPLRPYLCQAVASWCQRPGTAITVQPVIDLNEHRDSVAANPTSSLRRRAMLRRSTCMFPWCDRVSWACDADHGFPWSAGGSTCDCNLNPLCRRHHRLKTLAGWSYTPFETTGASVDPDRAHPGPAVSWLWRSPHGHALLVDADGTRDITPEDG